MSKKLFPLIIMSKSHPSLLHSIIYKIYIQFSINSMAPSNVQYRLTLRRAYQLGHEVIK